MRGAEWYNTWDVTLDEPAVFDNSWDGIYNCAKRAGAKFPELLQLSGHLICMERTCKRQKQLFWD